jgi:mitogen-activated protein kinase 1/3
VEDKFEYIK